MWQRESLVDPRRLPRQPEPQTCLGNASFG
jgi:hypothetical protein